MGKLSLCVMLLGAIVAVSHSVPTKNGSGSVKADEMWIANIAHGTSSFHQNPGDYKVYRNVMDFGCIGDGIADDTSCINVAISSGGRCGLGQCGSSTLTPALVYFPSGKYKISSPIIMYYFTQLVGNANDRPTLVAAENFDGMAIIDVNPYLGGEAQWYTNQNNFFRQIRNFIFDTTAAPASKGVNCIHWQVAQATSLFNLHFVMPDNSEHIGVWMENGSGGFMSDLVFDGGKQGMWVGNQQFLTRNLIFNRCTTAVLVHWNWQWSFKNLQINNCGVGIEMDNPNDVKYNNVGSIILLDSVIRDTQVGVKIAANPNPVNDTSGTLLLDNVKLENVGVAVQEVSGATILEGGSNTVVSWGRGSFYDNDSGVGRFATGNLPAPQKSGSLLDGQGNFFEKSRPQYETVNVNDFASVKDFGAQGNGQADDSDAIQMAIDQSKGSKIVFFPSGSYLISKTIQVPSGSRLTGETWSVLMAHGDHFQSETSPQPMIRVGEPGEVGEVEFTDLMFSVKGPQVGAILVEWNIRGSSAGAAGMWDTHFRVAGSMGSELQADKCPKGQGYTPACIGAFMLMHVTKSGSGYFENVWAWTADHDLDHVENSGQITIYTGRGILVESTDGPNWLYGTQSEHNVLYNYQLSETKNVFMTMIQSEVPYWQPGPPAPAPFTPNPVYNDPTFDHCQGKLSCEMGWGVRSVRSSEIYLYGAGLYNFFFDYDTTCQATQTCQDAYLNLEGNSHFYMYNLNTYGATHMVMADNTKVLATQDGNGNTFCYAINAFLTQA